MSALLGLGALLVLSRLMATKEQLEAAEVRIDRWAKPVFWFAVTLAGYLFVGYPLLIGPPR